jgi:transposase
MPVIIGMNLHKRSATIEVINELGDRITAGKFGTNQAGYAEMLSAGRRFAERVWAVEGCNGVGRHIAHRLVHDGETVLDVPAKLSAQVRVFATGNGRKTDPVDAHSVALAALRAPNLVRVQADPELVVLGMLVDRRDELGRARTQTVNRLHRLLLELFLGGAKKFLSATQARALVATIKPRDIAGKTRRRLVVELIAELESPPTSIPARRGRRPRPRRYGPRLSPRARRPCAAKGAIVASCQWADGRHSLEVGAAQPSQGVPETGSELDIRASRPARRCRATPTCVEPGTG